MDEHETIVGMGKSFVLLTLGSGVTFLYFVLAYC